MIPYGTWRNFEDLSKNVKKIIIIMIIKSNKIKVKMFYNCIYGGKK